MQNGLREFADGVSGHTLRAVPAERIPITNYCLVGGNSVCVLNDDDYFNRVPKTY